MLVRPLYRKHLSFGNTLNIEKKDGAKILVKNFVKLVNVNIFYMR